MDIQTASRTGHPAGNEIRQMPIPEIDRALNALATAVSCHIISIADARKQRDLLMGMKKQKILETYPIKTWQASNGTWKPMFQTAPRQGAGRLSKESLENNILEDYRKRMDDSHI